MEYNVQILPSEKVDFFNEEQWIKNLFLISDMQSCLNDAERALLFQLPFKNKKKLFRKSFYLSAHVFAHILEKHYYKIQRFPNTGKFTLAVAEILFIIRDSYAQLPAPISGSGYLQRKTDIGRVIGFDRSGRSTQILTVVTEAGGRIITAFPGTIES